MESFKIANVPHILEIIDAKILQNVQDFFAQTFDIPLICFFNGDWLTEPSNHKDFCNKYIDSSKLNLEKCHNCHVCWENKAKKAKKPVRCECYAGISGFAVPVFIKKQYVGSVLSGQFLLHPLNDKILSQIIKNVDIDPENDLVYDLKKIKILTDKQLDIIMESLYMVGSAIAAMIYANLKLAELGFEKKTINGKSIQKWFSDNYGEPETTFTKRESEILKLVAEGKNNNEIAKELYISVHTAKAHVSSIIEKFGVEDRVQVAVKATKEGYI